jgi:hypothetical protein
MNLQGIEHRRIVRAIVDDAKRHLRLCRHPTTRAYSQAPDPDRAQSRAPGSP